MADHQRLRSVTGLVFLMLVVAFLATVLTGGEKAEPTPLGAAGKVSGGLARVNGIILLDGDGDGASESGSHPVRILLELTALEAEGLTFTASEYTVRGAGTGTLPLLAAAPEQAQLAPGQTLRTELVYELPDRSIELILEGPGGLLLSLGSDHHTGRP